MTAVGGRASEIDFDRLVDDLQTLVRTESITGSEEIVADWAAGALQEVGLTVEMVRPDLPTLRADPDWPGHEMPRTSLPIVVGRAGRAGGRRLILSGHLDVVPPGDPATWSMDPWSGELVDGRLYGRGACDMKGGVAAILAAVRMLAVGGGLDTLDGELQVVLVPSEEDGGQGTLGAIRAGATGDMAIITEPSRLDVIVAHGGSITFRLTVPGRAAHASRRREGISALDKLLVLTQALAVDEKRRNEAETDPLMTALGLPYPTIIGIVEGGEWASTVLDRVVAYGRYGVRLGQTPADAEAELQTVVAEACAADEFLREHPATIEITGGRFGSALMSQDHPLPAGLVEVAAEVMGRRPAMRAEPYGADMQMFVNHGGTPCVIFGPGDIKYGHSADEFVPIAEVETCARVLAAWVLREIGGG